MAAMERNRHAKHLKGFFNEIHLANITKKYMLFKGIISSFAIYSVDAQCPHLEKETYLNDFLGQVETVTCTNSKYRSFTGSCNNLEHPKWGTAGSTYIRLLPPNYGNGISSFAVSKSGKELPNARLLSRKLFFKRNIFDDRYTLLMMQFGQIISHDMSSLSLRKKNCCQQSLEFNKKSADCKPIEVFNDDPDYSRDGIRCLPFTRTTPDLSETKLKPRQQISEVTPFLDLDIVYGKNVNLSRILRAFKGGLLRTESHLGQKWPLHDKKVGTKDNPQYFPSDGRMNQHPQLTLLHIILLREHNRIATILAKLNPHWCDTRLYQEARKINIAQYQHIVFYEWLFILFGVKDNILYRKKVLYGKSGYVNDYKKDKKPGIFQEFSMSAFRNLHTLVPGNLLFVGKKRKSFKAMKLSDNFQKPGILESNLDSFDDLARGLCTQPQGRSDAFLTPEITSRLYKGNNHLGQDLKTLDIQRGRDHGLPSYNDVRKWAGLPKARRFEDFLDYIPLQSVLLLKTYYEHPDDVDLGVGADLEHLHSRSLLGITNFKIVIKQFYRTRISDRFWYENRGHFSLEQLAQIKKASISRLICDNGRNITIMQKYGFSLLSLKNPLLPCDKLPRVDLSAWRE